MLQEFMLPKAVHLEPLPDLVWFYTDSARELGFHASPMSAEPHSNLPTQKWPSASQCRAAVRQRKIREALRQLSTQLQSVLECVYDSKMTSVDERHKYDMAAPLVARILTRMRLASKDDQKKLKILIQNTPILVASAHSAFLIAFGSEPPQSRRAQRQARVRAWREEEHVQELSSAW